MSEYVALLRGINVGGKNLIKMAALKACFEKHGFTDVTTYIQSGNVLFKTSGAAGPKLTLGIEKVLAATFKYRASVVVRSKKQMQQIVAGAPKGFGEDPELYRYDVMFLKDSLTAAAAMKSVPTKPGVDQAYAGTGVIYFSRLISKAAQSKINRIASLPIYQSMTIRNWNTTTKLARMMETIDA
jgi:uncharacterized protein (DUF1697 family)